MSQREKRRDNASLVAALTHYQDRLDSLPENIENIENIASCYGDFAPLNRSEIQVMIDAALKEDEDND